MDPDPEHLSVLFASFDIILALNGIILILLLISSALISGSEIAFFSLNQTDINELSKNGIAIQDKENKTEWEYK